MTTIAQFQRKIQDLFGTTANRIAKESGFIQRQRKIQGSQFLQGIVFGFLAHPRATRQQLHQALGQTGLRVSAQGFEQRFNERAVAFLQRMVEEALGLVFESENLIPVLERFQGVYVTDCTRIEPTIYPVKIAARLELQSGGLQLSLETLATHDNATKVMTQPLPRGALHLGDLGFFDLERFAEWAEAGVDGVSRYKIGTYLYTLDQQPLDLEKVLSQVATTSALNVLVGQVHKLPMRLVAQRVNDKIYNQRLRRLRQTAQRKQQALSSRQQIFARWSLYLTSMRDLDFDQVHILVRARWQIERLFKRWKSLGQLATASTHNPHRRACEMWAKLLAVLVTHWLTQLHAWADPHLSYDKFFAAIQSVAVVIYLVCFHAPDLLPLLDRLLDHLQFSTTLSSRHTHPNAIQLWQAFDPAS